MQYNPPFGQTGDAGYVNANLSAGVQGSIPPAEQMELPQREIVATIAAAGLTPTNGDLRQLMQAIRGGALSFFQDVGIANTLLIYPNPQYVSYFIPMQLSVKVAQGNTGPTTINVNQLGPKPITKKGGQPLTGGEWSPGDVIQLLFNGTSFQIVGGGSSSGGSNVLNWVQNKAGAYTFPVPQGVSLILASIWGGGGAGAGVQSNNDFYATPCGGGGGGFASYLFVVTGGQQIAVQVGAGAPRTAAGQYAGTAGGTSSLLSLTATGGSGASLTVGPTPGGMGYGPAGALLLPGGVGRGGFFGANNTPVSGDGGSSWCSGPVPFAMGKQHDGEQPGQGGSGAASPNASPQAGGAGKDGMATIICVG